MASASAMVHHPDEFRPERTDTFVVDTSVLLLQYPPRTDRRRSRPEAVKYSEFLQLAHQRASRLVLVPEVLSEFIGVSTKKAAQASPDAQLANLSDKDRLIAFRESSGWAEFCDELDATLQSVVDLMALEPSPINSKDEALSVLEIFRAATLDWTDVALVKTAERKNGIIVTNDWDFARASSYVRIEVITTLR